MDGWMDGRTDGRTDDWRKFSRGNVWLQIWDNVNNNMQPPVYRFEPRNVYWNFTVGLFPYTPPTDLSPPIINKHHNTASFPNETTSMQFKRILHKTKKLHPCVTNSQHKNSTLIENAFRSQFKEIPPTIQSSSAHHAVTFRPPWYLHSHTLSGEFDGCICS